MMKDDVLVNKLAAAAQQMTKPELLAMRQVLTVASTLPTIQRDAITAAMVSAGCSWVAGRRKRTANRAADLKSRVLVGARVPRCRAHLYQIAAEQQGVSLYRWVSDALEAHLGAL